MRWIGKEVLMLEGRMGAVVGREAICWKPQSSYLACRKVVHMENRTHQQAEMAGMP